MNPEKLDKYKSESRLVRVLKNIGAALATSAPAVTIAALYTWGRDHEVKQSFCDTLDPQGNCYRVGYRTVTEQYTLGETLAQNGFLVGSSAIVGLIGGPYLVNRIRYHLAVRRLARDSNGSSQTPEVEDSRLPAEHTLNEHLEQEAASPDSLETAIDSHYVQESAIEYSPKVLAVGKKLKMDPKDGESEEDYQARLNAQLEVLIAKQKNGQN